MKSYRILISLICVFTVLACCSRQEESEILQRLFENTLQENLNAFNRYDWKMAADLFDENGTFSQPLYKIHQHGKQVLDSVMREAMQGHKKDSLQAKANYETRSLVIEDSVAYHVVNQYITIHSHQRKLSEYCSTNIIVWKLNRKNQWKIGYQLIYP